MTAGRGISHSEVSTDDTTVLHGVQLWLALPAAHRDTEPAFAHYAPPVVHGDGWDALVFFGSLLGEHLTGRDLQPAGRRRAHPGRRHTARPADRPARSSTACWSTSAPSASTASR